MNGILIVKLSSCRMRYTRQYMKSAAELADRRARRPPRAETPKNLIMRSLRFHPGYNPAGPSDLCKLQDVFEVILNYITS